MTEDDERQEHVDYQQGEDSDADLQRELDEALGDMSLDDLIDGEDLARAPAGRDDIRKGRVVAVHGDDVFVEFGPKSQGVLPAEQFKEDPLPVEGDLIEVTIQGYDGDDGLLLLSRPGAVQKADWDSIEVGQIVEGRVTGHNKGGLELDVQGIRAFMPISQIERFRVEDIEPYVEQQLRCMVSEVDRSARNVVVSRRDVLEVEAAEAREKMFETLEVGQVVNGTVRTVMPYGAFVDIGGADGLLHISEMSYSRVEDPNEIVTEGQELDVKILKIDPEERKIALGLKQVRPDPWTDADSKWAVDSVASGRITRLMDFGAFMELDEGVEGLIPIGEMTFTRRIRHPSEIVSEGDAVKVRVMSVDLERRRISLSLKRLEDDPWMGASVRWPPDSVAEGVVTRITEFGAFVELTAGVEGLVHVSELSEDRVRSVASVVSEGQLVQAKVLTVDEDARRISLSIKQLASMADYTGLESEEPEQTKEQPKRKRPLRGGLD